MQLPDVFAKALGRQQLDFMKDKMGVIDIQFPTWGGVLRYKDI